MHVPGLKLLPCVATTPLAGVLGAAVDEHQHQSLSLWLGMCQSARLSYLDALWLQLQLMPFALVFMLLAAFLGTLWAVLHSGKPATARILLAGHAGCAVATLAAPAICPWILGTGPPASLALAGMLASELALTLLVASGLLALASTQRPHAST